MTAFPKKLPDMPKGNWKAWLAFSPKIATKEKKEKETKPVKELKRTPLKPSTKPIKKTPLAKVGARKKARISEYGTESDFFFKVWEFAGWLEKAVICTCGCKQVIKDPFIQDEESGKWKLVKPQCFAHKLAKWLYPRFRYLRQNIGLVATFKCHSTQDKQLESPEVRNELEKEFDLLLKELT